MDTPAVIKLITLGDSSVGKTSLIVRFAENKFEQSHMPTIGIDSKSRTMKVGLGEFRVQLWDTAGQEKFRTISYSFYSRADGVLLVYDVTNRESLTHVKTWMDQIREKATKEVSILLIGNKVDLADPRDLALGEQMAQTYGIHLFLTSAKTGSNVEEAIEALVADIVRKNPGVGSQPNKSGRVQVSPSLAPKISETTICCK